ncbi:MAG: hypothetical protein KGK34_07280 [Chloroflexota bacterium]|nr:hypothetical protein [Chloroflexota bacterium]
MDDLSGIVKLITEVRDRVVRIETAIAGDPITGISGLQSRLRELERQRERDHFDRRIFRAMIAVATFVGSGIGAALSPFLGHR